MKATVDDACEKLGGSFDERFRFARVTGPSAKHDEQQVGRDHELADEDILRIVANRWLSRVGSRVHAND